MSEIITENLELWTSALLVKSTAGRGSNGKQGAYGIQKLRELILELAVRGKLVPQDPSDEPAKGLLEQIAEQKARLIAEGKIGNSRPLPAIDVAEIPFEIPDQWEWVRLGDLGEVFNGNSISKRVKEAKYTNIKGGLPFIATKDVGYGWQGLDYENGVSIPDKESNFKVAHKGAVLICAEGGSAGKKCGITDRDICFGNKLYALEPYVDIAPDFLLANYLEPTFFAQFSAKMTGIIGGISLAKFKQLLIPLPSASEQRRIVAKVSELMSLCDQLEQQQTHSIETHQTLVETLLGMLASVSSPQELTVAWSGIGDLFDILFTTEQSIDQLKQVVFQLAVMGMLVPQDQREESAAQLVRRIHEDNQGRKPKAEVVDEFPFSIPPGWSVTKLGSILNPHRGISYGVIKLGAEPANGGVNILRCSNVRFREIDLTGIRKITEELSAEYGRTILQGGEVLINVRGTLGGCAVVPQSMKGFNIAREVAVVPVHSELNPDYLLNVIAAPYFQNKVSENLRGIAYEGLNLGLLREFLVPIPPAAEQQRIVAKVNELITLCDTLKSRLTDAQATQVHLADAIVEQAVA